MKASHRAIRTRSTGLARRAHDRIWTRAPGGTEPPLMRRPAAYLLAAATVAVLGLNWPIMSKGVDLVPPLWLAAFRLGGAAIVIAISISVTEGIRLPDRADRWILVSVGLGRLALVTALVFSALSWVPPGRSSIVVYTASLWTAPLAVMFLHEHLTSHRVIGLVAGCGGIVLLLEPWALDWSDTRLLVGLGMLLTAAVTNAASTVHIRGHRWMVTPLQLMPWQLALGTIPIALLALLIEGAPHVRWTATTIAIVTYQVVLASAFGLWGLLTISRSLPAITTNLTLMGVPVVGLVSSVIVVDENVTALVVSSLLLILIGVGLGLLSDRRASEPVVPPGY